MKLALLGTDAEVLLLAANAAADGHQIVWTGDVRPEDHASLKQFLPGHTDIRADWETLLDHATADAVLMGCGAADAELRTEQLKRLVADAVPLLVVHPINLSVLVYYELDMVRRETGAVLRHYNPLLGHPLLVEIASWVRDGHDTIGRVLQVSCTRDVADSSRDAVLSGLARDAELLAAVAGDIRHVSAMGPSGTRLQIDVERALDASESRSYASLQVQMTTSSPASLRWSTVPSPISTGKVEMALIGERGAIYWAQSNPPASGTSSEPTYSLRVSTHDTPLELPSFDPPRTAIRQLQAAIAESDSQRRAATSTWSKATQAMEVVDAVELSLQKGRTIEVLQQQLTPQLAFRGTMAAIGCGLLLLTIVVATITAVLGGAEWMLQKPLVAHWPWAVLAVLGFFLLLQLVPVVAAQRRRRQAMQASAGDKYGQMEGDDRLH
jgi:hypothetical protein